MSFIVLCAALAAQAQVSESANWYNGCLTYSAKNMAEGKVLMNAMAEGEEHEFILVPVAGKKDTYTVADGPNDFVNVYSGITTVRHKQQDGLDVLCFYDSKNQLQAVMSNEGEEWDAQKINVERFKHQLIGQYELMGSPDGNLKLTIDWSDEVVINRQPASFNIETFNGMVMGYITIGYFDDGANRLEGTWEVVPTIEGFRLCGLTFDEETNWWERNGVNLEFREANPHMDRFGYASVILLNDRQFRKMDKATLRVMRNSILAHHGYNFQSKDLQEYFANQPWYNPAASNDGIKPTFLEQLNIELIKAEENK